MPYKLTASTRETFVNRGIPIPQIRIMALLPKTGANGSALLLHDRSLVGDRLGGAHIADELFHYKMSPSDGISIHELILPVSKTAPEFLQFPIG